MEFTMKNNLFLNLLMGLLIICFSVPLLAQQNEVSVTVYNQNLALIRDVRQIDVSKGVELIRFQNVAAQIDPTSVHLRSLNSPNDFTVLEQNFEYDLVNPDKILRKYIDHEIELFTAKDTIRGILMNSGNELVLSLPNDEIRVLQKKDIRSMNFPRLPEGLITQPTLIWLVQNVKKQTHQIETEYLTRGLTWHAEYVSILNDRETEMDITAWISVDNKSGIVYKNSKLKLVAGDVHLAEQRVRPQYEMAKVLSAADQSVSEKEFFEYHLYTVNRRTTLNNNQVKQIVFFDALGVNIEKKYVYEGQRRPKDVRIYTKFKNEKKNKLGLPFPSGKFRVYKKDTDGSMIFLGEDRINHTPKDEWIETLLGNAFDIKAERKQTNYRNIGSKKRQETYEIILRNHKKETVTIQVIEHFQSRGSKSEWRIIESTETFTKKDAMTAEFNIKVSPNKEVKLQYTVEYSWQ